MTEKNCLYCNNAKPLFIYDGKVKMKVHSDYVICARKHGDYHPRVLRNKQYCSNYDPFLDGEWVDRQI